MPSDVMDGPLAGLYLPALCGYLEHGITQVEGWLSPTTAAMIACLLVQQSREGVTGDVCEIGVHHGKLFLVLAAAMQARERAVAVDVFDDQDKNIDASGRGNRGIFERNAALHAPDALVEIVQESSLDLAGLGFGARRFRFMSIDGGHSEAVTANDLRLAEGVMLPGGLVALDDILSHQWTGVISGLVRYLAEGGTLVPFALVPNKLLLTTDLACASRWRDWLSRRFSAAVAKPALEFPGGIVASFNDHAGYAREGYTALLGEMEVLRRECADLRVEAEALRERVRVLGVAHGTAIGLRDDLAREVANLRASTSWRLMGPARMIAARLRRVS